MQNFCANFFFHQYFFFQDVEQSFDLITQDPGFNPVLAPLAAYIQATWIGTVGRPALFPINLWNIRERTLQGEPRTNNNLGEFI